jgi:hypothetical protein
VKRIKPLLLSGLLVFSQVIFGLAALSGQASAVTYPNVLKISGGVGGAESTGGTSFNGAISADGNFVAFPSHATNLIANDTNGMMDVFIRNLSNNAIERVSVDNAGQQIGANPVQTDRVGTLPSISSDSRLVSFVSPVPSLNGLPSFNYQSQIHVRDRLAGTTTLVSKAADGTVANAQSPYGKLSANGQWITFFSSGSNLVASDTNGKTDVFIKNLASGAVERISVASDGTQANGDSEFTSDSPLDISADGRFVLFASSASNLVASDTNGALTDVFLRDRQAGTTERFEPTNCATMGKNYRSGTISDDGRWVAFTATQCTTGTGGKVTLFDRQTSTLSIVNGMDDARDLSADGRYLLADNSNIFRYDRTTNVSTIYVPNSEGGSLSATGDSFSYHAQDQFSRFPIGPQPGDTNQAIDSFVYQLAAEPTPNYSYSGTLKDQNGNPLFRPSPTTIVALVDTDTGISAGHGFVNAQGQFTVVAPAGQYKLRATFSYVIANDGAGNDFDVTANGTTPIVDLQGPMANQNLVFRFVKLNIQVKDPEGNPVLAATCVDPDDGTAPQLLPDYLVTSSVAEQYCAPTNNGLVTFDVIPGSALHLHVNPDDTSLQQAFLQQPAITQDTTIEVVLPRALPPAMPQNVTAPSPTSSFPSLSWDSAETATSYKVFRDGAELDTTTDTTFTDSLVMDGPYEYTVAACNEFGCSDQSSPVTVVVYDTIGPVLGTPSWLNNPLTEGINATVTVAVNDALSDVVAGEYYMGTDPGQGNATAMNLNGNELSASFGDDLTPGTYTVFIRAKDAAGNWSAPIETQLVVEPQDTTAPVISYSLSTPPNASGWHKAPVTLTWTVEDAESAITNQMGCAQVTVNTDGTYTYFCSATSAGGTANQSVTIKYDATAPVVGHTLSTSANANGWHKANVTIDWQATDTGSGSPTDPANTVASTEAANATYTSGQSCDLAGNCAAGLVQISLDKTVPTQANFTPAMLFIVVGSQNFSIASTDSLSGVDRVEYYFDTDPEQGSGTAATHTTGNTYTGAIDTGGSNFLTPHSFFLRTRDRAGNWSTTLTRTYTEIF